MPAKRVLPWGKSLRFEALKVRIHPVKRSTSPARPRLPRVWKLPSSAVLEGGQRAAVEARIRGLGGGGAACLGPGRRPKLAEISAASYAFTAMT